MFPYSITVKSEWNDVANLEQTSKQMRTSGKRDSHFVSDGVPEHVRTDVTFILSLSRYLFYCVGEKALQFL